MSRRPSRCSGCHRYDTEVGRISFGGLCGACSEARVIENRRQMVEKTGPAWEKWQRSWSRSAGPSGRPETQF